MSRLAIWAPPILWMAVVLALSSAGFSAEKTGSMLHPLLGWLLPGLTREHLGAIHGAVRKLAHFTEYAILAALWFRALRRNGAVRPAAAAGLALGISVVCAMIDEGHQALVSARTGSPGDVLIDTLGAVVAVGALALGWRRVGDAATGLLLWVAAVGGLAALALELAAGAGGGLLWLTVPAAAGLVIYRWRKNGSQS